MATEKEIASFRRKLDRLLFAVGDLAAESRRLFGEENKVDEWLGNIECDICEAEGVLNDIVGGTGA